mgnify:CR=1 FL=1
MIKLLCRVSVTQKGKQEVRNPFVVRTLLFLSGERFPILVTAETNEPDFDTTIYVLTHLRVLNSPKREASKAREVRGQIGCVSVTQNNAFCAVFL